jgi:RHS repeat-associated protein
MRQAPPSAARRLTALLLAALCASSGACLPETPLEPRAGVPDHARLRLVPVPGGWVDTAGGNLVIERLDLSLDTPLGPQEIRAVYNAASGAWLWGFQMRYDGERFVDDTGAVYEGLASSPGLLTANGTIPGSRWVRVDATTLRTRGGLAHHFDGEGRLAWIAWAGLDYPRIVFAPGQIVQCTQPSTCTPLYDLVLDAAGNPLRVTDARSGRLAEFEYDALGRLVVARSPGDVALGRPGRRYEYDLLGTLLVAATSAEGERVEYDYQAGRRILHVTQLGAGSPRHRFEFYGLDPVLSRWTTVHTNPLGGETRYRYDAAARLREVERTQAGETTRLEYAGDSLAAAIRPSAVIRPDGARTEFGIDADDDVVRVVEPSGNVRTASWDAAALQQAASSERPLLRLDDSLGLLARVEYGPDGRSTRIELPEGRVLEATYQGAFLASLRDAFGRETTFEGYGVHGHWTRASVPALPFPVRRAFDPVGNLLVSAAGLQDGGVLDRSYDADRNLREIHVAASQEGSVTGEGHVRITRRSDGRPLAIERPRGADHAFDYDALGRLVSLRERVDGVWRTTTFEHDAAGHVVARQRPNGMREEWSHDVYGRVVRRAALRDGVLEGEALVSWAEARPVAVFDSIRGATEAYAYDAAGELALVAWSSGESIELARDLRGRVTEVAYRVPGQPDHRLAYAYDAADREIRVELDGELLAELHYSGARLESVRTGNGLLRVAGYDATTGRLAGFATTHPQQGVVESTSVTRAVDSGQFRITADTATPLASTSEVYRLGLGGLLSDPDRRLGNRVWGFDDGEDGAIRHVYDELSNQIDTSEGDTFVYNAERSRLLSASSHEGTSVSYLHDEAGFVRERNGAPLTWTASGRLAAWGALSFQWDMAGRPISVSAGGATRHFGRFGGAVETHPATGALRVLDLGFVRVDFDGGQRHYRHRDFRGNTSFVSDAGGEVVAHYRYAAYGLDAVFGSDGDRCRFAGGADLGDGLVLLGARVQDARTGRFLSQDPVFSELNQYAYTLGNPVQLWDPDGMHAETVAEAQWEVVRASHLFSGAVVGIVLAPLYAPLPLVAIPLALGALFVTGVDLGNALSELHELRSAPDGGGPGSGGGGGSPPGAGGRAPAPADKSVEIYVEATVEAPSATCAPARLASGVPDLRRLLALLVPLQLVLTCAVLRRRRF